MEGAGETQDENCGMWKCVGRRGERQFAGTQLENGSYDPRN